MSYLILVLVTLVLGLGAQAGIRSTYNRWSKVGIVNGRTGRQSAREMLDGSGLPAVPIQPTAGSLTDNFDPRGNVLNLSEGVFDGYSVAATAVACHEAGHAVQHARNYGPARFRIALVPMVNFASNAWVIVMILGFAIQLTGLIKLGIALFAFAVLFQIVTLPVEFDASRRAMGYIEGLGLPAEQVAGARRVLTAAAMTYVAAALASVLQLLYYIGVTRNN